MLNPTHAGTVQGVNGGVNDVLTVVEAPFRCRLGLALGEVAQPIHLDSLTEAVTVVGKRPVRGILFGTRSLESGAYSVVRKLATEGNGMLIAVVEGWTPEASDTLLALGRYGVRDVVDASSGDGCASSGGFSLATKRRWRSGCLMR